jgi:hypothetical protein
MRKRGDSDIDKGWSPYLSLDDAQKLDDVRSALLKGKVCKSYYACVHAHTSSVVVIPENKSLQRTSFTGH